MNPLTIATSLLESQVVRSLLARQISRRAFVRFGMDLGAGLAVSEVIDEAAKYSDWVKENQVMLELLSLGVGPAWRAGRKARELASLARATPVFFSKMGLSKAATAVKAVKAAGRFKVTGNGFKILFANGEELMAKLDGNGKWVFTGAGAIVVPALLASGFGGQASTTASHLQLQETADQILSVGSSFLYEHTTAILRDRIRDYAPASIMSGGAAIAAALKSEYPYLKEDQIVAEMFQAAARTEIHAGQKWVDAFHDEEDNFFVEIDGATFMYDDGIPGFIPQLPETRVYGHVNESEKCWLEMFGELLTELEEDNYELVYSEAQNKFFSNPVLFNKRALSVVWDEANRHFYFLAGEESLFDSALENLKDEQEDSLLDGAYHEASKAAASLDAAWDALWNDTSTGVIEANRTTHINSRDLAKRIGGK